MTRLKLVVHRVGNVVFGKVLEQDESLRGCGTLYEGNRLCIRSELSPELCSGDGPCSGDLLVQGNDHSMDDDWFAFAYGNESEAKIVIYNIKLGVAAINGNVEADRLDYLGLEIVE